MNITKSSVVGALLSLTVVAACGRDDKSTNNNIDAGGGGDTGSGSGGGMTIKDVQADSLPSGSAVELHGVVVTAIDSYGASVGDLWVQDVDGGARSGVHVFRPTTSDVTKLAVGDLVDIKGAIKYEYAGSTKNPTSAQSLTELEGASKGSMVVTKTGTGTVPAPHVLDAVAIAAMTAADRATFLEDWEGVPVTLQSARPINAGTFGTDADDHSFDVENVVTVESNMAAFPASAATAATCYASITGIVDFVIGKYTLLPYSTAGFIDGGTNCAAQAIAVAATVAEVQAGTKTGLVKLTGVYVMAAATKDNALNKTIWVSDTLQAAAGTGVEIFNATGIDATTSPLGTKVDVQGTVIEFDITTPADGDTLTELKTATVSLNAQAAGAPTPLVTTATLVGSIADSELYEGTLVTLSNLKVTAVNTQFHTVTLVDNDTKTIVMDDDAFFGYSLDSTKPLDPAVGTCYASLTGVMDVQTTNNTRSINPRFAADMLTGSTCTP